MRNWVGKATGGRVIVGQRLKRLPQIASKLERFPSMRLTQMEDIAGCRAVLFNNREIDAVARKMQQYWRIRWVSDYRRDGKPTTGYRGVHYIVERRDRLVEVQLRTRGQHLWAETVESVASRTGINLKDGDGPSELLEYFALASEIIWLNESEFDPDEGLRERFAELTYRVRSYLDPRRG